VINVVYQPDMITKVTNANPFRDQLSLKFNARKSDKVTIQVTTLDGRIVTNLQKSLNPGVQNMDIDTRKMAAQVYILKITNEEGRVLLADKVVKL
jgi:hypothetical protein